MVMWKNHFFPFSLELQELPLHLSIYCGVTISSLEKIELLWVWFLFFSSVENFLWNTWYHSACFFSILHFFLISGWDLTMLFHPCLPKLRIFATRNSLSLITNGNKSSLGLKLLISLFSPNRFIMQWDSKAVVVPYSIGLVFFLL